MAMSRTVENPPHTNAMITIIVIQVAAVMGEFLLSRGRSWSRFSENRVAATHTSAGAKDGPRKVAQASGVGKPVLAQWTGRRRREVWRDIFTPQAGAYGYRSTRTETSDALMVELSVRAA